MRYIAAAVLPVALLIIAAGRPVAQSVPGAMPVRGTVIGPEEREVQGVVRSVDRGIKAVRVARAGDPGDTVLLIIDATQVRIDGSEGSLESIREGARIRASYQDRYGINVAHSVEVTG
jgi:hypothetical protein